MIQKLTTCLTRRNTGQIILIVTGHFFWRSHSFTSSEKEWTIMMQLWRWHRHNANIIVQTYYMKINWAWKAISSFSRLYIFQQSYRISKLVCVAAKFSKLDSNIGNKLAINVSKHHIESYLPLRLHCWIQQRWRLKIGHAENIRKTWNRNPLLLSLQ